MFAFSNFPTFLFVLSIYILAIAPTSTSCYIFVVTCVTLILTFYFVYENGPCFSSIKHTSQRLKQETKQFILKNKFPREKIKSTYKKKLLI